MADVGRPTVMTEETIRKLEEAFLRGLSDREASLFADIAPSTLYLYCQENPGFSERKELLKENVKMRAKINISDGVAAEGIRSNSDKSLSQWYLERKDKEFKQKSDITSGDKPIPILDVQSRHSNETDTSPN